MRVVIIDNFDSFTFNLYQTVGETLSRTKAGFEVKVVRNNEIDLAGLKALQPDRLIISPGPGSPADEAYFGVCRAAILELGPQVPTLGVCLGMQGMVHAFGGTIVRAPLPMHGKVSSIHHDGHGVFNGIPQGIEVMRYHSLMAAPGDLPQEFEITSIVAPGDEAVTDYAAAAAKGCEIMGVRHRRYPIEGVQFHPESFATEGGRELLANFLTQP